MTEQLIPIATDVIKRALELESQKKLTEALVCYEQGIGIFLKCLKRSLDSCFKQRLKERIESYMTRAESIKDRIKTETKAGNYHEQININEGDIGYGYQRIFGRFLKDGSVTGVEIEDAYIRSSFQIEKFSHFCEILVRSQSPIQNIILKTSVDVQKPGEQLEKFEILQQDLSARAIRFEWVFSPTLHDRKIKFSNGWVVSIGRGLDYIRNSPHKFVGLGVHDFDFRPCLETTVDIYFLGESTK